ncbi:MAG: HAMP domain-containing protein [Vulcanimicrobiota bacterium]
MTFLKSIKTQIILFCILIAVVSSTIIGITNYLETGALLNRSFDRELDDTASLIKMNIEENLADARHTVSVLIDNESMKSLDRKRIDEISAHFIDFVNIFYNVFVYDRDGNLVSVTYYKRENLHELQSHSVNFKLKKGEFYRIASKVLEDGAPRFTSAFHSKNNLVTAYVAPITRGSEIQGVVSCGIVVDNPKLKKLLQSLVPPYSGFICLMDSDGNIFGSEGEAPQELPALAKNIVQQGGSRKLLLNERTYRYVVKKIRDSNLFIMVAISERYLKDMLFTLVRELIILNVISLFLVLGISTLLAHILVKPLKKLVEGLREIGKGNYSCRIETKVYGEMKEAVQSFNEMSLMLEKNRMIEKIWNENWKCEETEE